MICISGETADAIWLDARERFLDDRCAATVEGRTGETRELRPVLLHLTDPRARWVLSREALNPAAVLSEVVWILNGRRDAAFVNFFNNALKQFAGDVPQYYGAYGYRLRSSFGVDQLAAAADALKGSPESRQVCLSIWHPRLDMPMADGTARAEDIPCNVGSMLKVRQGRLEWTQVMRSNDLWLGLPFNIVQFTMLQEIMAGWLGLDVGTYHHLSDSLHVYPQHDAELAMTVPIEALPSNNDDLAATGRAESESVLRAMAVSIEGLEACGENVNALEQLGPSNEWPVPYANIYRVMWAEAARRSGFSGLGHEILADCSNPVLVEAQRRWIARLSG